MIFDHDDITSIDIIFENEVVKGEEASLISISTPTSTLESFGFVDDYIHTGTREVFILSDVCNELILFLI